MKLIEMDESYGKRFPILRVKFKKTLAYKTAIKFLGRKRREKFDVWIQFQNESRDEVQMTKEEFLTFLEDMFGRGYVLDYGDKNSIGFYLKMKDLLGFQPFSVFVWFN